MLSQFGVQVIHQSNHHHHNSNNNLSMEHAFHPNHHQKLTQQQQPQTVTHSQPQPSHSSSSPPQQSQPNQQTTEEETIDFTYVNVCETDEDEVDISFFMGQQQEDGEQTTLHTRDLRHARFDENVTHMNDSEASLWSRRGDVLTLLLSGAISNTSSGASTEYDTGRPHETANEPSCQETNSLVVLIEQANRATEQAAQAKQSGNLQASLDAHSAAAKCYRDAAQLVRSSNGTTLPIICFSLCHFHAQTLLLFYLPSYTVLFLF